MSESKSWLLKLAIGAAVTGGIGVFISKAANFKTNFKFDLSNYRAQKLTGISTLSTVAECKITNGNSLGLNITNLFVQIQYLENKFWYDLAKSPIIVPSLTVPANKVFNTSITLNYSLLSFPYFLLAKMFTGTPLKVKVISKFDIAGVTQTVPIELELAIPSAISSIIKNLLPKNVSGLGEANVGRLIKTAIRKRIMQPPQRLTIPNQMQKRLVQNKKILLHV
ncbi:MAG: hypothetical protein PSX81_02695 [bacterium]|nr:hypothetical protein [bacterium]